MKLQAFMVMTLCIAGCTRFPQEDDVKSLIAVHDRQREHHFSGDARKLVDLFSDDFISVNRGIVDSVLVRDEEMRKFQAYFDAVKFVKWDDLHAPITRFSDDHTLAYTVVDKIVIVQRSDSLGNVYQDSTHFAWTSIYRKEKGSTWKLECITSTNETPISND